MLNTSNSEEKDIVDVIREVLVEHEVNVEGNITHQQKLIDDLGFSSLMFAQLIMMLQDKFEYDPFSDEQSEIAISDMVTVGNIIHAYLKNNIKDIY